MDLSNRSKILILVILVVVAVYFLSGSNNVEPVHNEGMLTQDSSTYENDKIIDVDTENSIPTDLESKQSSLSTDSQNTYDTHESANDEKIRKKMRPRDQQEEYRSSSYKNGNRQSKSSELDRFFQGNHPQDTVNMKGFSPVIENEGSYAAYASDKHKKKLTDKDKFNPDALLPKEKTDWFDDPLDSTNVKSNKLININRPVAVNTIQTTLKNPSHDIRGTPANPKYPISPWGNSSYEPDTNLRNQSISNFKTIFFISFL